MLEIKSLEFAWPDNKFIYNLKVSKGETVTIEGPSGVGKSTLIDLIAGFLVPLKGNIKWMGKSINALSPKDRPTSTIFQSNNLFEHLNCEFNASLGISPTGKLKTFEKEILINFFKHLNIFHLLDRYPNQISGGQKARVALARSLLSKKEIILLDEPVSSLDFETRKDTLLVLKNTAKEFNLTLIIVSHQIDDRKFLGARPIFIT